MYYRDSKSLLEKIHNSQNFLLGFHEGPDYDSVASNLSLKAVLENMGKSVTITMVEVLPLALNFINGTDIAKLLGTSKIDFGSFDLLLCLDASDLSRLHLENTSLPVAIIDHHEVSSKYDLNILDKKSSSVCEMLFKIFIDWEVEITPELATMLLIGICGDTGFFQFSNTNAETVKVVWELMNKGGDYNYCILNMIRRNNEDLLKIWGEILKNVVIDKEHKFVYSAIDHETFIRYPKASKVTSSSSNILIRTVEDTLFGIVMAEKKKNYLEISARARIPGYSIYEMCKELGGGGHADSSGAIIKDLPFEKAVETVLEVARKYSSQK